MGGKIGKPKERLQQKQADKSSKVVTKHVVFSVKTNPLKSFKSSNTSKVIKNPANINAKTVVIELNKSDILSKSTKSSKIKHKSDKSCKQQFDERSQKATDIKNQIEKPHSRLTIDSISSRTRDEPSILKRLGWELHQEIGYGGFSTVYKATNRNLPNTFACKVFRLNALNKCWIERCLKNEMRIMIKLRHPNIVAAYDAFKTHTTAYIFMKFAYYGSMDTYITIRHGGKVNELPLGRKWFYSLMSGLEYLHRHHIAHRDLKLDNFLLDKQLEPMIADFSFSVNINDSKISNVSPLSLSTSNSEQLLRTTVCGTAHYTAPEIHKIKEEQGEAYDAIKADIYSMGICLYEMLHGVPPFEGTFRMGSIRLLKRQMCCDYHISSHLSTNCQQLIVQLLQPSPQYRPYAKDIINHVWFRSPPLIDPPNDEASISNTTTGPTTIISNDSTIKLDDCTTKLNL